MNLTKHKLTFIGLTVVLSSFLFVGCATGPTRKQLSKVGYGTPVAKVWKTLDVSPDDNRHLPSFRIGTTNGVLEMITVFSGEGGGEWYLLFKNGVFVSARTEQQYSFEKRWGGFSDKEQPDFDELAPYWEGFFPPIEPQTLLPLQTNVFDHAQSGRIEGVIWGIYFAPIIVPALIVAAPIVYLASDDTPESVTPYNVHVGMEQEAAMFLLGIPEKQIGESSRCVRSFRNGRISAGFEQGKIAFIFFNINVCR
ncbi:MAG TPA: hypothetical protein VFZ59_28220 [Verrucomicrobiae bacterium]|nr:hypothetical protein [Verrucomicrobiae bacterium]